MKEITANLNNAECLVQTNDFLSVSIHNVCNGDITIVPHGSLDLLMGGILIVVLVVFISVLIAITTGKI